jgi:hypothetical protein
MLLRKGERTKFKAQFIENEKRDLRKTAETFSHFSSDKTCRRTDKCNTDSDGPSQFRHDFWGQAFQQA